MIDDKAGEKAGEIITTMLQQVRANDGSVGVVRWSRLCNPQHSALVQVQRYVTHLDDFGLVHAGRDDVRVMHVLEQHRLSCIAEDDQPPKQSPQVHLLRAELGRTRRLRPRPSSGPYHSGSAVTT